MKTWVDYWRDLEKLSFSSADADEILVALGHLRGKMPPPRLNEVALQWGYLRVTSPKELFLWEGVLGNVQEPERSSFLSSCEEREEDALTSPLTKGTVLKEAREAGEWARIYAYSNGNPCMAQLGPDKAAYGQVFIGMLMCQASGTPYQETITWYECSVVGTEHTGWKSVGAAALTMPPYKKGEMESVVLHLYRDGGFPAYREVFEDDTSWARDGVGRPWHK